MYTHYDLMLPLLKVMQLNDVTYSLKEAYDALILELHCSEEEINETMEDGRNVIFYRLQWAKTYLKKAGFIDYPQRAHFKLSNLGRGIDLKNLKKLDRKYLSQFDSFNEFRKVNLKAQKELRKENVEEINLSSDELTPPEIITQQSNLLKNDLKIDLLTLVKNNSPQFFERLVVDLLVAMGYGGSHQDAAQAIGKTSDGGIDGIISEDRLGLDKIYVQAKRWENTVGRPDIQQFKGALADQVAKKGVFITTSSFSREAIESAKKSGIVLIDGDKLTSLMIEFGLGVQIERSFYIYKIDQDRFDEDNF
ncbi:restriction endonuclease [Acinetobacter bereziniae]|uniref:Restriction endonuclease n=1 Tax=Acinetobacter bereziniae TaxID=106648 RepID=A0A8I1AKM2_ACIBZ|nr:MULTISPECIES: restriction endonuclease [Acinetobacter]MEC8125009.1 restriction endonuclease [Pseudomonadota bacterium]KKW78549.1 restriction endonuclease [Acinetobacter sp. Ag2]MBJ8423966.1 restriction endonuclease [Acinetobacter bereziniae]MCU4474969.1 restriction endonuclease [Acinetobacter bereziniae]MCU4543164.1 restriction endonuclease [Acinetobacter bereziniae]